MSPRPRARVAAAPRIGAAATVGNDDWRALTCAAALAVACGVLYALSAARDIVLGDSAEFVTVAATLGVAHPPGYPLLSLLGHLLAHVPIGSVPFRVNLLSVLASAGTIAFVFLIARRITGRTVPSALAALLLSTQPLFWEWSLVIEAFSLNGFLAAATVYWLLRWDERPASDRWLILAAWFGALGIANHHTIAFLIPSALWVVWRNRAHVLSRPGPLAGAAIAAIAGLSLYAYLPWAAARQPPINWGDISSTRDLLQHVLRTSYGTFELSSAPAADQAGLASDRLAVLLQSFTPIEGLLVGLGAVATFRSARRYFWTCAVTAALSGPGFALIAHINVHLKGYAWVLDRFFVLPHVVLAPLAASALIAISHAVGAWWLRGRRGLSQGLVAVTASAVILAAVVTQYRDVDQHDNHLARTFADDILNTLAPNAVLLAGTDDVVLPIAYLQAAEHQRPDVTLVMLGPLSRGEWYVRELRSRAPRLVVPFDRYNPLNQAATIRALVDANPARPFALIGPPTDTSLERGYWYWPRGLVLQIEPAAHDVAIADLGAENDRLFRGYRIPSSDLTRHSNFDPYVLLRYSTGARLVGAQYAAAQMNAEAAAWFQRAVAIDPDDAAARVSLDRILALKR